MLGARGFSPWRRGAVVDTIKGCVLPLISAVVLFHHDPCLSDFTAPSFALQRLPPTARRTDEQTCIDTERVKEGKKKQKEEERILR